MISVMSFCFGFVVGGFFGAVFAWHYIMRTISKLEKILEEADSG